MWNVVCRNPDGAWSYKNQNQQQIFVITYNQLVHHSMQTTQACLHKNALSMVGKISQLHES